MKTRRIAKKRITLRIPNEMLEKIQSIAQKDGMTMTDVILSLINIGLQSYRLNVESIEEIPVDRFLEMLRLQVGNVLDEKLGERGL